MKHSTIISDAILTALHEAEKWLKEADKHQEACEAETDETQAIVMTAEARWSVDNTEEAGIALDRAYDLHDKAMKEYYEATEEVKELETLIEMLSHAEWYVPIEW